ncbi:hypothetical protein COLO4_33037 [Corchorus olitorius]|uniref:RNase H type-1 domain-containing protein n=1 Tax=Corchorus olitorius TaxID=93759 RepID=A0A1R3GWT1_9ROSI|nr:hypothetical protein COLO4_33037 [Corchorus olitorius]
MGRATPIKSTMAAIPTYYMQARILPQSICSSLDRINPIFKAVEFSALAISRPPSQLPTFTPVKWFPPKPGWFKLNTDGSALGNPGRGGAGSIIRDHDGNWVIGSYHSLGSVTNTVAELWSLRDGLTLANKKQISHLK